MYAFKETTNSQQCMEFFKRSVHMIAEDGNLTKLVKTIFGYDINVPICEDKKAFIQMFQDNINEQNTDGHIMTVHVCFHKIDVSKSRYGDFSNVDNYTKFTNDINLFISTESITEN